MSYPAFDPGPTTTISATTSSAATTLTGAPQSGPYQVRIYNSGTVVVFLRIGATATTGDIPLAPGVPEVFTLDNGQVISTITASGAATVYATVGNGY